MRKRNALMAVALVALAACSKTAEPVGDQGGQAGQTSPEATSSAPSPASESGGETKSYKCASLLTDQEIQQATGLSDAALLNQENGKAVKGQTYCQYFGKQGAVSIAVSVLTGPAFDQVYKPLEAAASQAQVESISGLGDAAAWGNDALGFRVDSIGVTIFFTNMGGGGSLGISDPKGAAIAMAKLIVSRL